MEKTIKELRLRRGLTVKSASELSGITSERIKRWESNGCGRADPHAVCQLLRVYRYSIDHVDFNRKATQRQVLESILTGASKAMASGRIEVDMDKVISLMSQEGFETSELEAVCSQDKNKTPSCYEQRERHRLKPIDGIIARVSCDGQAPPVPTSGVGYQGQCSVPHKPKRKVDLTMGRR